MKGVKNDEKNSHKVLFGEARTPGLVEEAVSSRITLRRKTLFGDDDPVRKIQHLESESAVLHTSLSPRKVRVEHRNKWKEV